MMRWAALVLMLLASSPAYAEDQQLDIKISVSDLTVIAQALGGCVAYNQALKLLNDLQKQMNDQMAKPATAPPSEK